MKKSVLVQIMVCGIVLLFLGTSMHCVTKDIAKSQATPIVLPYPLGHDSFNNSTEYFAVICACSRYENPRYNLPRGSPAPESKLRVLYDALLQTKNWNQDHIMLLLNENATRQHILDALSTMSAMVGPEDIFLFTWNGHGSEVSDSDGDEAVWDPDDTFDEVICPYDTNKSTGNFTNIITDDELGYYFSQIHAKGTFLVFECCLSGGLVDQENFGGRGLSSSESDVLQNNLDPRTLDVNGEHRIVLMSTLPSTLGRATLTTHAPLLSSVAKVIRNGENYDRNNDGNLSAEEIFRGARPRMLMQSSVLWMFLFISNYLYFKFDMYHLYDGFLPSLAKFYRLYERVIPIPFALATCLTLGVYLLIQLLEMRSTGHCVFNWPTMQDDYLGELSIVQL